MGKSAVHTHTSMIILLLQTVISGRPQEHLIGKSNQDTFEKESLRFTISHTRHLLTESLISAVTNDHQSHTPAIAAFIFCLSRANTSRNRYLLFFPNIKNAIIGQRRRDGKRLGSPRLNCKNLVQIAAHFMGFQTLLMS